MLQTNLNYQIGNFNNYRINFNGNIEKIMNSLKTVTDYKRARVTLEEALKIYNRLGYITKLKAGSHVTIIAPFKLPNSTSNFEYAMTLPHGSEKRFISPFDVKRLKYALNGDLNALIHCIKI